MARILLGVSAGIAAYKSADLASKLTQRGDRVRVILTPGATRFVTPLTFRALTGEPVGTRVFEDDPDASMEHIALAEWADVLVMAPATADLLGRLAAGLADDLLTTTALAFFKPVAVFPAMNDRMWSHPIVRENIARLRNVAGYRVIDPESGHLACGSVGPGRLPPPEAIEAVIDELLATAAGVEPES